MINRVFLKHELLLKNNNFIFNDEYFCQLLGTAMGTTIAPTYAVLVMGHLKIHFYEKRKQTFRMNAGNYFEENW